MLRFYLFAITSFAMLITGCSTVAPPAVTPTKQISWQDREIQLSKIENWHLNGKIGVQTAQDSGSATIDWTQRNNRYTVSLTGPLGSNAVKLNGQPGKVTMETSDGKMMTADSAEALLAQGWGFHLPVSNLRYWVRGLPVPGIKGKPTLDQYQRITSLKQGGWMVNYQSYTTVGGVDLPSRMTISSSALKTKLVIYSWNS